MNEDYLIVLCRNCHECMERHIKRFKAQVNVSATITKDIYINIMKRSILDFYQNSFYKPNTKATIMGFSLHDGFCSLRNILASQIQARFPDIEIMAEEGWLYYQLPTFSIEMSGVIEWRNSVIAEALDEGIKAYAIKNRFRMSDKSYYKALQSIGR